MMSRRDLLTASAAGIAVGTTGLAPFGFAQPGMKTTRILVGFPAGGTVDFVARLLANEIRDHSSAVVVENRSGAGGRVALEGLKSSVADGSTMILTPAATMVVYPHIYNALKYDAFADFAPVAKICDFPYLLAIGPMVPGRVETLADFVAWCRANPGRATYGTAGAGNSASFHRCHVGSRCRFRIYSRSVSGGGACRSKSSGRPNRCGRSPDPRRAPAHPIGKCASTRDDRSAAKPLASRIADHQGGRISFA